MTTTDLIIAIEDAIELEHNKAKQLLENHVKYGWHAGYEEGAYKARQVIADIIYQWNEMQGY